MNKPWLASYPPGMPAEIDAHAFASLNAMFERSFSRFGAQIALSNYGATLTYRDLDRLSAAFAGFLARGLGLARGERIAIMLPNLMQYPVAMIGALRAALTVVNVNPLYTAHELRHPLADSGASAIVVLDDFTPALAQALPGTAVRHVVQTSAGDLFPPLKRLVARFYGKRPVRIPGATRLLDALAHAPFAGEASGEDLAFLQYTGGTTGRPKGAMLTHANLVANVEQTLAWSGGTLAEGSETVLTALPLFHVFALTANLLLFMRLGGCNALVTDPRDFAALAAQMSRVKPTAMTGVNTLFKALLEQRGFSSGGALKLAIAGGMAVQRDVAERWQQATGVPLIEGYGLTEASPNVCANRFDARAFSGTVGLPLPSTEVAILDPESVPLAPGEVGEICVRGPQVMRGYWNAPDETRQSFAPGGWLRTGDLGRMDANGQVEFVERRKDVIVVGGFKVYPSEVEGVALLHPGVRDAGAVGMPDPRRGESVAIFIVRKDPSLDAAELREHFARHLARYKQPRRIEFRDALPKSPIGKVLHRELSAS